LGAARALAGSRFAGKLKSAILSRTPDRCFVSLRLESDQVVAVLRKPSSRGVDLGLKALADQRRQRHQEPKARSFYQKNCVAYLALILDRFS
jgi:hypothetical protein